jgi:branched-chain amino acid transport system substrate-binding protein
MLRVQIGVALIVAATLVAGCGGDDSSAEEGSASSTGKDPIKVMVLSAANNQYYNYPSVWTIAHVFADSINADGGIGGAPLEIVDCNDQAQATFASRCAREAGEKKVVALVGGVTVHGDVINPILESSKIPWLGSTPNVPSDYTSPAIYGLNNTPFAWVYAAHLAAQECESIGVVYLNQPVNVGLSKQFVLPVLEKAGMSPTVVPISTQQTDLTPVAARVADNECIYFLMPTQFQEQLVKALEATGKQNRIYSINGVFTQDTVDASPSVTEGATVLGFQAPGATAPSWSGVREDIERYADDPVDLTNAITLGTWAALTIFADVAGEVSGPVTSSSFTDQLNRTSEATAGGLVGPVDYTKPFPMAEFARLFQHYVTIMKVKDGELVQEGDFIDAGPVFEANVN